MIRRQQGITAIGFLLLAAVFGVVGFGGLKLAPIYLDNLKVQRLLEDIKLEYDGQNPSVAQLRSSIEKRLNIESVSGVGVRDFIVTRGERGTRVEVVYESRASFLANIYLVAAFDNSVEILR